MRKFFNFFSTSVRAAHPRLATARSRILLNTENNLDIKTSVKDTTNRSGVYHKNHDVLSTLSSSNSDISNLISHKNSEWFIDDKYSSVKVISSSSSSPKHETTTKESIPRQSIEKVDERGALKLEFILDYLVNEMKASNVVVIDMRDKCTWTEFMVISSGLNKTHVRQLSESFYVMAKKTVTAKSHEKNTIPQSDIKDDVEEDTDRMEEYIVPASKLTIEGRHDPDWKVVDLGNVLVHFFTEKARTEYNLEEIWNIKQ